MADDWQAVGQAITDRISALSLTKAEVIARSGVSDKTLSGYMDGQPIVRADKRRQLCEALGWAPTSIDSILAGGDPIVIDSPGPSSIEERLNRVEGLLHEVLRRLAPEDQ